MFNRREIPAISLYHLQGGGAATTWAPAPMAIWAAWHPTTPAPMIVTWGETKGGANKIKLRMVSKINKIN